MTDEQLLLIKKVNEKDSEIYNIFLDACIKTSKDVDGEFIKLSNRAKMVENETQDIVDAIIRYMFFYSCMVELFGNLEQLAAKQEYNGKPMPKVRGKNGRFIKYDILCSNSVVDVVRANIYLNCDTTEYEMGICYFDTNVDRDIQNDTHLLASKLKVMIYTGEKMQELVYISEDLVLKEITLDKIKQMFESI